MRFDMRICLLWLLSATTYAAKVAVGSARSDTSGFGNAHKASTTVLQAPGVAQSPTSTTSRHVSTSNDPPMLAVRAASSSALNLSVSLDGLGIDSDSISTFLSRMASGGVQFSIGGEKLSLHGTAARNRSASNILCSAEDWKDGLEEGLRKGLEESEMSLAGTLKLASSPVECYPVFSGFFADVSGSFEEYLPRCLMETAVNDFCSVNKRINVSSTGPDVTKAKGGRWHSYSFDDYNRTDLYIGLEIDSDSELCQKYQRVLANDSGGVDLHCKERLLTQIVDRGELYNERQCLKI